MNIFVNHWANLCAVVMCAVLVVGCSSNGSDSNPAPADKTPDAFTFTVETIADDVEFEGEYEASTTIKGIDTAAPIKVEGGQYKIGATGTYTAESGTVTNGQTVFVQVVASDKPETVATVTLTVNITAVTFTVTTKADDIPPVVEVKFPPPSSMTEGDTVYIRGIASDEHSDISSVNVNGQPAIVTTNEDGSTAWSLEDVALSLGENTLTVKVTDSKANEKELSVKVLNVEDLSVAFPNNETPFSRMSFIDVDAISDTPRAFVSDRNLNGVVEVDLLTGQRSILSDNTTAREVDFDSPFGVAFDLENTLYVSDFSFFHAIDLTTKGRGVIASVNDQNSLMVNPIGIRFSSGLLYAADLWSIYSIDPSGTQTIISSVKTGDSAGEGAQFKSELNDLSVDAGENKLYSIDITGGDVVRTDIATGNREVLFAFDFTSSRGIAFDIKRNRLFITDDINRQVYVENIDLPRSPTVYDSTNPSEVNSMRTPWSISIKEELGYAIVVDRGFQGLVAMDLETGHRVIISKSDTTPK